MLKVTIMVEDIKKGIIKADTKKETIKVDIRRATIKEVIKKIATKKLMDRQKVETTGIQNRILLEGTHKVDKVVMANRALLQNV